MRKKSEENAMDWLPLKQQRAILALSSGMPACEVAKTLGVNAGTISKWKAMPLFSSALRDEFRRVSEEFSNERTRIALLALKEIENILKSSADPREKLIAAKIVIDNEQAANRESVQIPINATNVQIIRMTPSQVTELTKEKERIRQKLVSENNKT